MHLIAPKAPAVVHSRLSDVAQDDDITLLEHIAPVPDGHHLHLAVPGLAGHEVGKDLHVVEIHPTVQIRKALRRRMAVVVCPCSDVRTGYQQGCARGPANEFSAGWLGASLPAPFRGTVA